MFPSLAKSQFHLCKYQKRSFKVLHITHGLPRTLESSGPSTTMVSYSLHPLTLPSTELSTFSRTAEASLVTRMVKNLPAMQKTQVWSLDLEDPLEREMATHSSILGWTILCTEEPGRLQSMGLQRVGLDWMTNTHVVIAEIKYATNVVHCCHPQSIPLQPRSVERSFSMKPVPGTRNLGHLWFRW